jgi:homoserine acetyltransferase
MSGDQIFDATDALLRKGGSLPVAQLAGKTAGTLNARRDNAEVMAT